LKDEQHKQAQASTLTARIMVPAMVPALTVRTGAIWEKAGLEEVLVMKQQEAVCVHITCNM
jgi:hypothetical protein